MSSRSCIEQVTTTVVHVLSWLCMPFSSPMDQKFFLFRKKIKKKKNWSSSFLPPLTRELPHGQRLIWRFYNLGLKLERKSIQNSWVLRSDTQLIPRMMSENSLPLVTWSGSNAWTEVGAKLMRWSLSLSRAAGDKVGSVLSRISYHRVYTMGQQGRFRCFWLWNLATSFSRPSHPASRWILKLVAECTEHHQPLLTNVAGASLSEPQTSMTALQDACVCLSVCLSVCMSVCLCVAIYWKFKLNKRKRRYAYISNLHTC